MLAAALRLPVLRAGSRRRRQAGWAQLAANLFPVVGVLLLGWSFAEMLAVFFCETALLVLLAPSQFTSGPVVRALKVLAWYGGWCLLFYFYALLGLGVVLIAEAARFKGVHDDLEAAFNVMITGDLARSPSLAEFLAHPLAHSMILALGTAILAARRDGDGWARRLVPECGARAAYFHVGLVYFGIAVVFVFAFVPWLSAAFVTLPLVGFKILADARDPAPPVPTT